MGLSVDDLFSANEIVQADVLAKSSSDVESSQAEPMTPCCGKWFFAFHSARFSTKTFIVSRGGRWTEDIIEFYEKIARTFTIVLDNLDCVYNHSGVRVCIYDEGAEYLTEEVCDKYPNRSWRVRPDIYLVDKNCVVFSADVKFHSIQSLMRFIYSLDNCFALNGEEYPDINSRDFASEREYLSPYGQLVCREMTMEDGSFYKFGLPFSLYSVMRHNSGILEVSQKQDLIKSLLRLYTNFNNYTPSLHAYNWLCQTLNTNLSYGLMNYSIQLKTGEILQETSEPAFDFYIKNKFDHCTMDVYKAMQMNRKRCFFVTNDISITSDKEVINFDDLENETSNRLMQYFEENNWKMKFDDSRFVVSTHKSGNVDYLVSVFRIGPFEFPNPYYNPDKNDSSRSHSIVLSPIMFKETGFAICTRLANPDTAFDRHFRLLQDLIVDETTIEYDQIKYNIKNWYISLLTKKKDWQWQQIHSYC